MTLWIGNLRKDPELFNYPFDFAIKLAGVLEIEEDIQSSAAIMKRCFRLDPENYASAEELVQDPWFDGVE